MKAIEFSLRVAMEAYYAILDNNILHESIQQETSNTYFFEDELEDMLFETLISGGISEDEFKIVHIN